MAWLLSVPPTVVVVILMAVLAVAAVYDIRFRRIPNWLTVFGVLAGILVNTLIGRPNGGVLLSLEGFAVGFFGYMLLYLLRAAGAGDVKLMGAVGALVGPARWFGIFLVTALVGGVVALVAVTLRGRLRKTLWNVAFIFSEMGHARPAYVAREELDINSPKAVGLPRGAVAFVSAILYLLMALNFSR